MLPRTVLCEIELYLVHETPSPIFTRLKRTHDRMLGGVKMFGRMLVLRRVTAADVPADHAQAQVHPPVAHLQTLFATLRVRLDLGDLIQMRAVRHFPAP